MTDKTTMTVNEDEPDFFRLIFQFKTHEQLQTFMAFVGDAVDQQLIDVEWDWGAEAVHQYRSNREDDDAAG